MKSFALLIVASLTFVHSLNGHNRSIKHSLDPDAIELPSDPSSNGYGEIQTEALSKLIRLANPSVMIVDVRDIKTDDGKRIPGAKTIPLDAPSGNITANMPDKEATIIVYCSNAQCSASKLFADRLVRMGYKNIWVYSAGIEEWEQKGQKIERGKTAAQSASETGPKSA